MTLLQAIKKGDTPDLIHAVAKAEGVPAVHLVDLLGRGRAVVPANRGRIVERPCAVGEGLRTKVNANIGTSQDHADPAAEMEKLRAAVDAGADTVMDLSTGGDLPSIRRAIIDASPVPVGSVPVYDAACSAVAGGGGIVHLSPEDILGAVERHASDGIDFATIHAGITRRGVERLREQGRLMDVVSRGGAILTTWMLANDRENPLYERFDDVLDIARTYDMTLSLGDALRPGAIADATDRAQLEELVTLGELAARARNAGVQVMIEGPGHVPLHRVRANVEIEKDLCDGAPFYVLGPVVTDVAPGYDHICAAIGGAVAAMSGADFLCYVTPSEHLRLPTADDVREGVFVTRIAAHAADVAKGVPGAADWDAEMSRKRKARDWKGQVALAINPGLARAMREGDVPATEDVCTMCGEFCAIKVVEEYLRRNGGDE